jgi:hypothetical protein
MQLRYSTSTSLLSSSSSKSWGVIVILIILLQLVLICTHTQHISATPHTTYQQHTHNTQLHTAAHKDLHKHNTAVVLVMMILHVAGNRILHRPAYLEHLGAARVLAGHALLLIRLFALAILLVVCSTSITCTFAVSPTHLRLFLLSATARLRAASLRATAAATHPASAPAHPACTCAHNRCSCFRLIPLELVEVKLLLLHLLLHGMLDGLHLLLHLQALLVLFRLCCQEPFLFLFIHLSHVNLSFFCFRFFVFFLSIFFSGPTFNRPTGHLPTVQLATYQLPNCPTTNRPTSHIPTAQLATYQPPIFFSFQPPTTRFSFLNKKRETALYNSDALST